MPAEPEISFRETPYGRMRSRTLGAPRDGVPEVVLVQGMAVANYLVPGLAALGGWTRAHLVELPGYCGSGDPPRRLDMTGYGDAVVAWLAAAALDRVVLAGHSSGTQAAARAVTRTPPGVRALVLASPTIDPRFRGWVRVLRAWHRDNKSEPPDLDEQHKPERRRAGLAGVVHALRVSLADPLEDVVPRVPVPVLVLHGDQDRLCTDAWARRLGDLAPDGRYASVPGPHSFPWVHPDAWSEPVRRLAAGLP